MDLENVAQVAFETMGKRKAYPAREPGFAFHHGRRTAKIALELAGELGFDGDMDVLHVGSLFHDIGKGLDPHHKTGALLTREYLKGLCTAEELDAICEIVHDHVLKRDAGLPAGTQIVQDADILDHVGPIVVWMGFYWSGTYDETIEDSLRYMYGEENARYQASMREALNFDVSRDIFDRRIAFEKDFFGTFRRTHEGNMFPWET